MTEQSVTGEKQWGLLTEPEAQCRERLRTRPEPTQNAALHTRPVTVTPEGTVLETVN